MNIIKTLEFFSSIKGPYYIQKGSCYYYIYKDKYYSLNTGGRYPYEISLNNLLERLFDKEELIKPEEYEEPFTICGSKLPLHIKNIITRDFIRGRKQKLRSYYYQKSLTNPKLVDTTNSDLDIDYIEDGWLSYYLYEFRNSYYLVDCIELQEYINALLKLDSKLDEEDKDYELIKIKDYLYERGNLNSRAD